MQGGTPSIEVMIIMGFLGELAAIFLFLRLFQLVRCGGFILLTGLGLFKIIFRHFPMLLDLCSRDFGMTGIIKEIGSFSYRFQEPEFYLTNGMYIVGIIWCLVSLRKIRRAEFRPVMPQ